MLGLFKKGTDIPAKVEYATIELPLLERLTHSAELRWNGLIMFDESLLAEGFKNLKSFEPWPSSDQTHSLTSGNFGWISKN